MMYGTSDDSVESKEAPPGDAASARGEKTVRANANTPKHTARKLVKPRPRRPTPDRSRFMMGISTRKARPTGQPAATSCPPTARPKSIPGPAGIPLPPGRVRPANGGECRDLDQGWTGALPRLLLGKLADHPFELAD